MLTKMAHLDRLSAKERSAVLALQNGHIFANVWGELFARGILTREVFNIGLDELLTAGDYARLDIAITILTTVLKLAKANGTDCSGLQELLVHTRKRREENKALLEALGFKASCIY